MKKDKFSSSKGVCTMEEISKEKQAKITELLRSIPHPGSVILDSVGTGLSGFNLRPKTIPKKVIGPIDELTWAVELKVVKGEDKNFLDGHPIKLELRSKKWMEWSSKETPFTIQAEDVGKEIDTVTEREKNFNRNILHKFLDQFPLTITVEKGDQKRIIEPDSYPVYFWKNPVHVSGSARSSNMLPINATINGFNDSVIKIDNNLSFSSYWDILKEEERPLMEVVLKWHKALISLYQLIKKDNVDIPIDFEKMEKICWDEINAVS